jgi:hypothetical protein
MKSSDVRRSVQQLQRDRAPGDAPSMGRMARIPGTGLPKESRGERRKRSGSSRRGKMLNWEQRLIKVRVAMFAGVLLILLVLVTVRFRNQDSRDDQAADLASQADNADRIRVVSKFPSPSKEAALALVKNGLAVREPKNVARFFRTMENRDQEVVDFLSGMASIDGSIADYQWLSSIDANRLSLDGVNVVFKGVEKTTNRLAVLTPDASGKWKIDFDAFARTVNPGWKTILDPTNQVAVVRVFIGKDSYHNGPFRDEKQWACYGMASPDTEEVLLGYCKVDSPQEAALEAVLSKGEKLKRVTLAIRRVASADVRQFEIYQVIAEDWVVTDSIFQADFADVRLRLPDPIR